jgi:hypothetical protein
MNPLEFFLYVCECVCVCLCFQICGGKTVLLTKKLACFLFIFSKLSSSFIFYYFFFFFKINKKQIYFHNQIRQIAKEKMNFNAIYFSVIGFF